MKFNIERFDGNNYRQWKFQINCALRAKGIDINIPKPDRDFSAWNKHDGMAMCIMTSAMDFKQISFIENCSTAAEIITKLDSIYEQKSELNKMMIHERFYQYKMMPSDSIAQHISKVERLAQQLKESGENISDMALMTKILSTLPSKYRTLRQAWMSLDPKQQTIHNLTARLLDEEASLTSEEQSEIALVTQNKNGNIRKVENKSKNSRQRFVCYNCNKRGHFLPENVVHQGKYRNLKNKEIR